MGTHDLFPIFFTTISPVSVPRSCGNKISGKSRHSCRSVSPPLPFPIAQENNQRYGKKLKGKKKKKKKKKKGKAKKKGKGKKGVSLTDAPFAAPLESYSLSAPRPR